MCYVSQYPVRHLKLWCVIITNNDYSLKNNNFFNAIRIKQVFYLDLKLQSLNDKFN